MIKELNKEAIIDMIEKNKKAALKRGCDKLTGSYYDERVFNADDIYISEKEINQYNPYKRDYIDENDEIPFLDEQSRVKEIIIQGTIEALRKEWRGDYSPQYLKERFPGAYKDIWG